MKTMLKIAVLALLALSGARSPAAFADPEQPRLEEAKPTNGVFFTYTGYMTTVLELKDGRFRYWFESDMKMVPEPSYPLTGVYSISKHTITLSNDQVSQKEWTFRKVNGATTLWRPDAMEFKPGTRLDLKRLKNFGIGSILTLTGKPAEEVWSHRGAPSE